MGDTAKERVENMEKRDFAKYLKESAGRVEHISCRNFFFDGVVLTNKQDMAKTTHILHVLDTTPLVLGDVVFFENSYWILFQKKWMTDGQNKKKYLTARKSNEVKRYNSNYFNYYVFVGAALLLLRLYIFYIVLP